MTPENFIHTIPFDGNLGSHKLEEPQDGKEAVFTPILGTIWATKTMSIVLYVGVCYNN